METYYDYTAFTPDGKIDYFYGDTMEEAYAEALEEYGQGVTIRPSFYKEWICGLYKEGQKCGYTPDGKHIRAGEVVNG